MAVYVRLGLAANSVYFHDQLEAVCVRIFLPKRKTLYVASVYRPTARELATVEFVSKLEVAVENCQASSKRSTLVLAGDFNAKNSVWWCGQRSNEAGLLLANCAAAHGLVQTVEGPTHAVNEPAASQLDLMFINNISLVEDCEVLSPFSDHCRTVLSLSLRRPRQSPRQHEVLDFDKADLSGLNSFLAESDWSSVLNCADVEQGLHSWHAIVQRAVSQFVPMTVYTVHPANKPWYSPFLHRLRRQRERLYRRSKLLDEQHHLRVAYRKVRNWYTAELRNAERLYYLRLTDGLSTKELTRKRSCWWARAKSACGLQSNNVVPPLQANGKVHITAMDRAECLNKAFSAQCSAPSLGQQPPQLDPAQCSFAFQPVSVSDVYKSLSELNTNKAAGMDGVSNRLLRSCASALAEPLCHLFNLSLAKSVLPLSWKSTIAQPIFKQKGERSVPTNYRPIALLPCLSKVLEGFVRKQLLSYCLENDLIPDEQYGFLPKRSTTWQLLAVLDQWERALEEGHCIHASFLDVAKAFDRVNHDLLLSRLSCLGVQGSELAWLGSYLQDRRISNHCGWCFFLLCCQLHPGCHKAQYLGLFCLSCIFVTCLLPCQMTVHFLLMTH